MVENKTGAGGQIAIQYVKSQPADGATMLQTPTSMLTIYPHIYKKLSYDPATDLSPVSLACVFDFGFAVGPAVPESVKNINDFMAWAKANPAQANFGSPAAGSTPHFVGALLGRHAGVEIKDVAYRGTQPAMLDLLGGQIAAVSGPIGDITQHLPTGKVRILAYAYTRRAPVAPEIPTMIEAGVKGYEAYTFNLILGPANVPQPVVDVLDQASRRMMKDPATIKFLEDIAAVPTTDTSPLVTAKFIKDEIAKWAPVIRAAGVRIE